ncbi:MAG TPA: DNA primase [Burkholderiaceae bacterium]|nr:DNA primase [Burkholderiaceae bacterium]
MIPTGFVHELLSRVDIVDVVGRHVELKKAGINHKGLCPFHGEKTPSFIVSPSRQTYHCFGCGAHGDALRFLTEHTGIGFVDAVHDLAQNVGLQVPRDEASEEERARTAELRARQATLTDVLARAAQHYQGQLRASPAAIDYLKGRGLTGEIALRFGLGYAPPGWRGLASVFPKYDDPVLAEAGLVIVQGEEEAEQKRYDRFRDRIMFPIRSIQGDVIGFGGRVLDQDEPKYLNSPETPVFVKGRELYGLYEARQAVRAKGFALVVEGYMDVVALAQLGFPNAVATLGTACTSDHVQKLFRFTESVVFSFDGDVAGRRAATRALEASLPHAGDTRTIRFLFLPPEHDPDSYIREFGTEAFEQCVGRAVPLSQQLVEVARNSCDLDTAEGRSRFLAQARPLWQALPEGALRRQVLGELAALSRLEVDDLLAMWGRPQAAISPAVQRTPAAQPQRWASGLRKLLPGTPTLLDRALWLLITRSELWNQLEGPAHDLLAEQPAPYGPAFVWLERHLTHHGPEHPATLLGMMLGEDFGPHSAALVDRVGELHEPDGQTDLLADLRRVLERLRLQTVKDELNLLFESGELSPDASLRARELLRVLADLTRSTASPA